MMGKDITLKEYQFCGVLKSELPDKHAESQRTMDKIREDLLMLVAASPVVFDTEPWEESLASLREAVIEKLDSYGAAYHQHCIFERALEDIDNVEESY